MKFRKKPVVIEAFRFDTKFDVMATEEFKRAICCCSAIRKPHIHTLEGGHIVSGGDWIIKGVRGEFYPCKPGIFKQTYEEVRE